MSKAWIKQWTNVLDNPKVMRLPSDQFKAWSLLLNIAGRHDQNGALPSLDSCAYIMRTTTEKLQPYVDALVEARLIDRDGDAEYRMHDWLDWQTSKPSDTPERVRERVARSRENRRGEVVTPSIALQGDTQMDVVTPRNAIPIRVTPVTPGNDGNDGNAYRTEEIRIDQIRGDESVGSAPSAPDASAPATQTTTPKPQRRAKTPLPDPFEVTDAMMDWAEQERGYPGEFIVSASEYFVNWAESHDHRYVDWPAVWRNVLDSRWKEQHGNKVVQLRRA